MKMQTETGAWGRTQSPHRDDDVDVTARAVKKQRVGRKRPADVDALGYRKPDAGLDQPFLFAVPEESVVPCVRGDTADPDPRPNDGVDAFWRDALDRIN
jgi:hypothetical protein